MTTLGDARMSSLADKIEEQGEVEVKPKKSPKVAKGKKVGIIKK